MAYDAWLTPPETILPRVRQLFGGAFLDPASNAVAAPYVGTPNWWQYEDPEAGNYDGLSFPWTDWDVWCNPPYSAPLPFVDHAARGCRSYCMLVNAKPCSTWAQRLFAMSTIIFTAKRIKFWKIQDGSAHPVWRSETTGKLGNNPKYDTAFAYAGPRPDDFCDLFGDLGVIMRPVTHHPKRIFVSLASVMQPEA